MTANFCDFGLNPIFSGTKPRTEGTKETNRWTGLSELKAFVFALIVHMQNEKLLFCKGCNHIAKKETTEEEKIFTNQT